ALILCYPNFDKTFIVHANASGFGLGTVLVQKDDEDKEYASYELTKAEKTIVLQNSSALQYCGQLNISNTTS
ncbi:5327_t:CDS:1, partial [Gigaspora rosea]